MLNNYLYRQVDNQLKIWKEQKKRKPLMLRGARQVGKTSTVRKLSESFEYYLEINFEEHTKVHELFSGDLSPENICNNLAILYNMPVVAGKTLLFFDEIQSCIPAISSLRFFYEKMPDLHLISAGSLIEFALEELPSFGVGRVRTLFIYPFSFDEFLIAIGENLLLNAKKKASAKNPLSIPVHEKLVDLLKRFFIIGGMPEVVSTYTKSKDLLLCKNVLDDLIISLRADFSKYKKLVPSSRIYEIFDSVVRQTGSKFIYSDASADANHRQIKEALQLLVKAGLVMPVTHSSANGIPLGAESNQKRQKMLLLDTGLYLNILGLPYSEVLFSDNSQLINKGVITELYVGLEIMKSGSCYEQKELYYWHREAKNSSAEIDYIIQQSMEIIPIEVKSSGKGSMRSMHLFLKEKKNRYGYRFSMENFTKYNNILVFPLYAITNAFVNE